MKTIHRLKPSHRQAIRMIVLGLPVKEAAAHIGISHTFMSTVYNSEPGRVYAAHLRDLTDRYTAALAAMGLVPDDITRPRRGPAKR